MAVPGPAELLAVAYSPGAPPDHKRDAEARLRALARSDEGLVWALEACQTGGCSEEALLWATSVLQYAAECRWAALPPPARAAVLAACWRPLHQPAGTAPHFMVRVLGRGARCTVHQPARTHAPPPPPPRWPSARPRSPILPAWTGPTPTPTIGGSCRRCWGASSTWRLGSCYSRQRWRASTCWQPPRRWACGARCGACVWVGVCVFVCRGGAGCVAGGTRRGRKLAAFTPHTHPPCPRHTPRCPLPPSPASRRGSRSCSPWL